MRSSVSLIALLGYQGLVNVCDSILLLARVLTVQLYDRIRLKNPTLEQPT
jgi:hypothetical protein